MNYPAARPFLRSGDLLAWGHEAWRTWHDLEVQFVRVFTRSEYAHVGVAWCVGKRVLVIEAVVPAVRIFPLSRLLPCYWLRDEIREQWDNKAELTAMAIVGQRYSKVEAIKSAITKVVPGANEKWQCAEAAAFIRSKLLLEDFGDAPTPTGLVTRALRQGALLAMLEE